MKQNIISLIFGIVAISCVLAAIITLISLKEYVPMVPTTANDPLTFERVYSLTEIILNAVFAFFGIGCGLVALLVGRKGTSGSRMRMIGIIWGITGIAGSVIMLVVCFVS